MRRLWIGVLILVLLLGTGIGVTVFADHVHTQISDALSQAADAALAGDWDSANRLSFGAKKQWDAYHNLTASITDHEPVEESDGLFSQLEVYEKTQQAAAFSACCEALSVFAKAIGEAQSVSWWSLL